MLGELIRRAGPPEAVPPLVTRRVRRNVEAAWRDARRRRRRPYYAAAAAVLAAVAIGLVTLPGRVAAPASPFGTVARVEGRPAVDGGASLTAGAALRLGDRVVTGGADGLAVETLDGASIRIDGGTSLVAETPRRLRLSRGAVYVDSGTSAPVSGDAFEIITPYGRVTDVGTQFQVRIVDEHAAVLVREGLVDWDWAEALATPFVIEGATLYDFLEWAARETGRELRFASSAARRRAQQIRLSGDIGAWRPDEAITPVVATAGLTGQVTVTVDAIEVR